MQWQEDVGFVLILHKASGGAPFPFREASFRYALRAEGDATRLTTQMSYSLRGGHLVERLLAKTFNNVVHQITENLKACYESGQTQNRDVLDAPVQGRTTSE
ncbi:hypothetical protein [Pseudomonas sp. VD9]|uniref:hypothetical protein n=1 Tax=Pseudomonas sp. VD9 TaxID=3342076 RepID=UPI003C6C2BB7